MGSSSSKLIKHKGYFWGSPYGQKVYIEVLQKTVVVTFRKNDQEPLVFPLGTIRTFGATDDRFVLESGRDGPTGAGYLEFQVKTAELLKSQIQQAIDEEAKLIAASDELKRESMSSWVNEQATAASQLSNNRSSTYSQDPSTIPVPNLNRHSKPPPLSLNNLSNFEHFNSQPNTSDNRRQVDSAINISDGPPTTGDMRTNYLDFTKVSLPSATSQQSSDLCPSASTLNSVRLAMSSTPKGIDSPTSCGSPHPINYVAIDNKKTKAVNAVYHMNNLYT